ncbi:hypothetical protein C8J56DRAFT_945536 [Mycena floridula]|nr:hypothetical protein C8J56DRAFT_945536 [Mycena floridula]
MSGIVSASVIPFELVLDILETAVADSPITALVFVLISRDIQYCIDPFIYRKIILRSSKAAESFSESIKTATKPLSFYRRHVKTLCLSSDKACSQETCRTILSACTGASVIGLSFPSSHLVPAIAEVFRMSSLTGLRKLCCNMQAFDKSYFSFPSFSQLTHLEVLVISVPRFEWAVLQNLPDLTHLCLFSLNNFRPAVQSSAITLPESLKVCGVYTTLRLIVETPKEWFENHDPRIVLVSVDDLGGVEMKRCVVFRRCLEEQFVEDWSDLPSNPLGLWELADAAVQVQRALAT